MDGHHADEIGRFARIALQFPLADIEPMDEAGKAGSMHGLVSEGRIDQFVDRIVRLPAEPRDEVSPALPRPDEHPVKQGFGRIEICARQEVTQTGYGLRNHGLAAFAQMVPQPFLLGPRAMGEQVILAPADQRRRQKVGKVEIV